MMPIGGCPSLLPSLLTNWAENGFQYKLYGPWGHDALGGENPFCLGMRCENTPFCLLAA